MSATFTRVFGTVPEVTASAPGRVNLIGEHTDYNQGLVLPTAIPGETSAGLRARDDGRVRAWSAEAPGVAAGAEHRRGGPAGIVEFRLGEERRTGAWSDYVAGVTRTLALSHPGGAAMRGFDVAFRSTVPIGAGVSSSAALAVALLRALRLRFELPLDEVAVARLVQRAENEFAGAHVGIMDPMAVSLATPGRALFLDTRDLRWELIPIPGDIAFVVIDSGVKHRHAAGDYNRRRAECEHAASLLRVDSLRDVTPERAGLLDRLPDPERRRARHVVSENQRVLEAVRALRTADGESLGRLFRASHASLRDDFEVSVPEVDQLVAILDGEDGVFGARITGGGFGGSVVAAVQAGAEEAIAVRAARRYAGGSGRTPAVVMPEPR